MADMVSIMNAILAAGGTEYATRVPQATRDNITAVGNAILSAPTTTEKFLNLLVNRIAMTIVRTKTYNNPLKVLKKGGIPLGNTVQEMFVNPAKGNAFDPTGSTLLSRTMPDTKVLYHAKNRESQYEVTFNKTMLKQAFTSYAKLEELLNGVINSLYSGDNIDEFILMKDTIAEAISGNKMITCSIDAVTSAGGQKKFIKNVRNATSYFQYPGSQFNAYAKVNTADAAKPVVTWTPKEDQILLIRSDIITELDVEVLAQAFNMDKTTLLANTLEVDTFGSATKCNAVLADKAWFQIYDNEYGMESFYNPKGMYWNYYLNHWQTYSLSLFANAVAFVEP